jgi:phosphate-selective porin OprO/OprP
MMYGLTMVMLLAAPAPSRALEQTDRPAPDDTIEAGEAATEEPRRKLVRWNEYQGPYFTIRFGGGVLYDFAAFGQDHDSKKQVELAPTYKLRDFRFLLKGRFPAFERAASNGRRASI